MLFCDWGQVMSLQVHQNVLFLVDKCLSMSGVLKQWVGKLKVGCGKMGHLKVKSFQRKSDIFRQMLIKQRPLERSRTWET